MDTIVDEFTSLVNSFVQAATVDPLSALLVLFGMGLLAVTIGVVGVLAIGAIIDLVRTV
ncbi:hypothetical protein K0C01_04815 [Salinarchaeum sp. IM2453]|uniref:hypothetical protein n=1 Tax=Salinarchaeum sp. IM2453 TaxID=2862870 RepID=UPI001C83AA81|nr:hypothetical protein [Salinarchaeum sp. IM2453]QZA89461.1 hypothetical protein K0C01_04815 [Salinarchaeum sp. IM2453]